MPSIRVRALPQPSSANVPAALAAIRDVVCDVLVVPSARVRVLWETIEPGRYLQGDEAPAVQPAASHPPTVDVLGFEGRSQVQVTELLEHVADALVRHLGLEPGNAWVTWSELRLGHLCVDGVIPRT